MPPDEGMDASVDPEEVARFDRLAENWWNPRGPMRALHQFNPVRVDYLRRLLSQRFRKDAPRIAATASKASKSST